MSRITLRGVKQSSMGGVEPGLLAVLSRVLLEDVLEFVFVRGGD